MIPKPPEVLHNSHRLDQPIRLLIAQRISSVLSGEFARDTFSIALQI